MSAAVSLCNTMQLPHAHAMSVYMYCVGPADYDPEMTTNQSGLLCSKEERFKSSPRTRLGPGSYHVRIPHTCIMYMCIIIVKHVYMYMYVY